MAAPFAWAQVAPEKAPLQALSGAHVVFLGEIHDNPTHHLIQSDLMAGLGPSAVVFEMLTPEQAALMEAGPFKTLTELDALIGWEAAGWPDISIYGPVISQSMGKPIYGAGVPRAQVRPVMETSAAKAFGPEAARFGLSAPLPEDQAIARNKLQADAHCGAMPDEMLPLMVEVQRFRDARLAQVALEAFETHGPPVVVITGNGHARKDWGAPFALFQANPAILIAAVGLFEKPQEKRPPYDSWMVTEAIERPDPCLAFK
jgi:uncharacterized iron-regulated protein